MKKTHNSAFSLIELSIVILIIGILIAGMTQGSGLYAKFKLQSARQLTQSSPVNGIKDIALWLETSMPTSFKDSETVSGGNISAWYNNSSQVSSKIGASLNDPYTSSNNCASGPTYLESGINGLPSIRFNPTGGSSSRCMNIDGRIFVNTNFTVFIVSAQIRTNVSFNFVISGTTYDSNDNVAIGWRNGTSVYFWNYQGLEPNGAIISPNRNFGTTPLIISSWFSSSAGKKLWINGGVNPVASDSTQTKIFYTYPGASMGRFLSFFSSFDVSELIVFQRSLTDEERISVEKYLGQKYGIKTN